MTTQEQPTTDAPLSRRYEILWNDDGRHVSRLTYTQEQIDDIDEIVETVLRGMGADKGLDIDVELVPSQVSVGD